MSDSGKYIEVSAQIAGDIRDVWEKWTHPEHVVNWNFASDDWHCPHAENDLHVGGKFMYRMEDKAGHNGFDFRGVYARVEPQKIIEYLIEDGRRVHVEFRSTDDGVQVVQRFNAEEIHPREKQQDGWQSILNNFKSYVENN